MPSAKCSISHAICYSALLHLNFACVCGVSLGETLFRTRVPVPSSDLRRLVFGLVLDFGFLVVFLSVSGILTRAISRAPSSGGWNIVIFRLLQESPNRIHETKTE